ncbi:uncharacterized protein EV154DRAFT_488872 [Mucor mucedo]|uniref:uncharacterized protein n=1 Tax=Mucor mucedo TaxID=29922 RepID=UPI0022209364|nr:uncharacterized protein EV154DRAFT_488872 [Mucor mucedo]KAI7864549.1 hypothetical protein EV154DRAFT_488872 [Mucor mucedo]
MACGIYAPNQIKSYIIYYVIKKNCQSTELPVEERPMATPRKRVVVEEASSSGSYKKQKKPSKNPNINDEAGCSDYNSDNNNDSGAHQVNDAVKTKKAPVVQEKKSHLPDLELLNNNIQFMINENMLMPIKIPVAPQLTDETKKSEIKVFARAVKDYHDNGISFGNWGTTTQYSGCFRFYCFGETLKKEYPGFHATFVELLKKCDYTQNKIAQMKVAGKRFNTLLYYFKHGAFAIAALYSTNAMRKLTDVEFDEIIAYIKKNRQLSDQLRSMILDKDMLERVGELEYQEFNHKKAL